MSKLKVSYHLVFHNWDIYTFLSSRFLDYTKPFYEELVTVPARHLHMTV